MRFSDQFEIHFRRAVLEIAYEDDGPQDVSRVILLHGCHDAPRSGTSFCTQRAIERSFLIFADRNSRA